MEFKNCAWLYYNRSTRLFRYYTMTNVLMFIIYKPRLYISNIRADFIIPRMSARLRFKTGDIWKRGLCPPN